MADDLPARIDRAALERIIQRAAELQTGEHEIADQLTPDEVLRLGKDVGIPARYLQQAMLEERIRTPEAQLSGALDRWIGPGDVAAQRVIRGAAPDIERLLLEWMDQHELLTIQRQQPGRITWEPLGGLQMAIRRSSAAFGGGKRPFMLSKASVVAGTITPLEPGFCHVSLTATARQARAAFLGGGAAIATAGAGAALILGLLSPFWWIAALPLPFAVGGGLGVARLYRPVAERLQLGLERALDHLERGEIKPAHALPATRQSLMGLIAGEIQKAISGPRA